MHPNCLKIPLNIMKPHQDQQFKAQVPKSIQVKSSNFPSCCLKEIIYMHMYTGALVCICMHVCVLDVCVCIPLPPVCTHACTYTDTTISPPALSEMLPTEKLIHSLHSAKTNKKNGHVSSETSTS